MILLARYRLRLKKWAAYTVGKSYQHVAQGRGKAFKPGELEGYFNDLTAKAVWTGRFNGLGVPIVDTDTTKDFEFPILIFQWALGNWDEWLLSGRKEAGHWKATEAAANWAISQLTDEGGWLCWTGLQRPVTSAYSAMAQGQGLSLLSRAAITAEFTKREEARAAMARACSLLLDDCVHGLSPEVDGRTHLEEYPGVVFPSVLNGWCFALVGILEYAVYRQDDTLMARARRLARDLAASIEQYDLGYWSTYDLNGTVASPFYHQLHIVQLRALAELFPHSAPTFGHWANVFESHQLSRINRVRAITKKVRQKIFQADVGEMQS